MILYLYQKTNNQPTLPDVNLTQIQYPNLSFPASIPQELKQQQVGFFALLAKDTYLGLPGGEPLTPVISVLVRGLLPDPVSPDVPGPVSPDVPVVPLVPISADISWYDEMQTEFVVSTEEQIAEIGRAHV